MSNQHTFNATVSEAKTFVADFFSNFTFTSNMETIHSFILGITTSASSIPIINSFSRANIRQYFGGFVTDVLVSTSARANILVNGVITAVSKTMLIINPRVNVRSGLYLFTTVLRQFINLISPILLLINVPKMRIKMMDTIKPKGTSMLITPPAVLATPLVRQSNHIYNVSGSTINDFKDLTLDQFNYTVI